MINPHVEPITFDVDEAGRVLVGVHQVLRDLSGNLLLDRMVEHLYLLEGELIRSMEIHE